MSFKDKWIVGVVEQEFVKHKDERGDLIEIFRCDTLPPGLAPAMSYLSFTEPGKGRGPHEHREQTDVFAFVGPGNFKIYLWDNRRESPTFGRRLILTAGEERPLTLIVPPGVIHAYRNLSRRERALVVNCPDRLYRGPGRNDPADEIRHEEPGDEFFREFCEL